MMNFFFFYFLSSFTVNLPLPATPSFFSFIPEKFLFLIQVTNFFLSMFWLLPISFSKPLDFLKGTNIPPNLGEVLGALVTAVMSANIYFHRVYISEQEKNFTFSLGCSLDEWKTSYYRPPKSKQPNSN